MSHLEWPPPCLFSLYWVSNRLTFSFGTWINTEYTDKEMEGVYFAILRRMTCGSLLTVYSLSRRSKFNPNT